ncbi:unnamed protein product, partial [Symbiodinium pilosum]
MEPANIGDLRPVGGDPVWVGDWALPRDQQGLKVLGTPLGSEAFVRNQLVLKREAHDRLLHAIPAVEDLQAAWLLLRYCAAPRANYLLRLLSPAATADYATEHDASDRQAAHLGHPGVTHLLSCGIGNRVTTSVDGSAVLPCDERAFESKHSLSVSHAGLHLLECGVGTERAQAPKDISDNKDPHAAPGLAQRDHAANSECSEGQRRDIGLGNTLGDDVEKPTILLIIKKDSEMFIGRPQKGLLPLPDGRLEAMPKIVRREADMITQLGECRARGKRLSDQRARRSRQLPQVRAACVVQEHARGQHEQLPTPEFLLRGGTRRSKPESSSQSATDGAPQFCRHALEGMHAFADLVLEGYGIKRNQACLKSLLSGCCVPLRPGRPVCGVALHVGRNTARRHGRRRGDCD